MRRQPVGMVVVDPLGDPDAARYAAFCLTGERRMERAIAYLVEVEAAPQRIENCGIDVAASGSLPCQKNIGALHFEDGGRSRITFRDVPEREPPPARIPWEISAVGHVAGKRSPRDGRLMNDLAAANASGLLSRIDMCHVAVPDKSGWQPGPGERLCRAPGAVSEASDRAARQIVTVHFGLPRRA